MRLIAAMLISVFLAGPALAAEAETRTKQKGSSSTTQAVSVTAQKPPTPEEMQKSFQAMAPVMGGMMAMVMENTAKKLAEPQMAEYYAAFARNYYLALVKQGFSEKEALEIVANAGLPSAGQQR